MMAITTSSSISVNALRVVFFVLNGSSIFEPNIIAVP